MLAVFAGFLNRSELALLGEVASLLETLLLLGRAVLSTGDNATMLVHHEMRLGESTAGLVGGAMPHLSARTLEHIKRLAVIVVGTIFVFLNSLNHFDYT